MLRLDLIYLYICQLDTRLLWAVATHDAVVGSQRSWSQDTRSANSWPPATLLLWISRPNLNYKGTFYV